MCGCISRFKEGITIILLKTVSIKISEEKTLTVTPLLVKRTLFLMLSLLVAAALGKKTLSAGRSEMKELDRRLQSIHFDSETAAVYVGDEFTSEPHAVPANAEVAYTWEIADDGVLAVEKGKIVARSAGNTLIGVTSGGISAQMNVQVRYKPLPPDSTLPPLYYEKLKLANFRNTLSPDYVPKNLVKVPDNYTAENYAGIYIDAEAFEAYKKMYMDMYFQVKNCRMHIISGYRSYAKQSELYNDAVQRYMSQGKTSTEARQLALNTTQTPGNSEHQLGTTIDVSNSNDTDHSYHKTPEGKWLAENAYQYGFIIRYPADKEDITRIAYEPWHIRYVGVNHAAYMAVNNLCLEQYVELQEEAEDAANDYALQNPAVPE